MAIKKEQHISRQFADYIAKTEFGSIPEATVELTKDRLIDNIGAGLAGSRSWEFSHRLLKGLKELGSGSATVFGCEEKLSYAAAALANSAFCHSLELDDGHNNAGVHAGAVVIPTALSVGEKMNSSGKDLITSIVLGYEVIYRIARNINPNQIRKGFHPSSTCGIFGAAAVAAKLLGLDEDGITNALGLAGLHSAGLMEATLSEQSSKCVMVGHASYAGILSAFLAKEGLQGPSSIFEGKFGFFNTMSEDVRVEDVLEGLGTRFEISDTYIKLYPTCRHIHPAIESLFFLKEEYGFSAGEISRVIVGTHEVAVDLTGRIFEPADPSEARFSLPYIAAVAIREGSVGVRHLEKDFFSDPVLRELAGRIEVRLDPEVNGEFPTKRGARVQVILKDGRSLEKTTYVLKGSPDLPVDRNEIHGKFFECASRILKQETAVALIDAVNGIQCHADTRSIMKLICIDR